MHLHVSGAGLSVAVRWAGPVDDAEGEACKRADGHTMRIYRCESWGDADGAFAQDTNCYLKYIDISPTYLYYIHNGPLNFVLNYSTFMYIDKISQNSL